MTELTREEIERVQAVKTRIVRDVNAWAAEHIVGRSEPGLVDEWNAHFRMLVERELPGYTGELIRPRVDGATLIADGTIIEKLD